MNDILKKISETISETGKNVSEKTKQVSDTAKLNAKIISSEHSVSDNYTLIGKYYYDTYKDSPDEEIAEAVNAVTAALATISELKGKRLALKGRIKCTCCNAACPIEDSFCGKCGAELEKHIVEETETFEDEIEETSEVEIEIGEDTEE